MNAPLSGMALAHKSISWAILTLAYFELWRRQGAEDHRQGSTAQPYRGAQH